MTRQFVIALVAIVATLAAVAGVAVVAASWLQRDRGETVMPRVADGFGTIASFLAGEAFVWDDQTSPMTVGPGTLTLAGGAPVDVPPRTPLYGNGCDAFTPGLPTAAGPPPVGTELVAAEVPPCFVQLGLDTDGRAAWLLGFASGAGTFVLTGDIRSVEPDHLVLEDGSTIPAAAPPVVGCEALDVTTIEQIAELDADIEVRVDPATGAAVEVVCVF